MYKLALSKFERPAMIDSMSLYVLLLIFPALMAFAGFMDLVTMTIPNKISIALVAGFLVAAAAIQMPLTDFAIHVAVGFGMLIVCMGLFAVNALGGGDAKLLPAAALWIGFDHLLGYMFWVAVLGGVLAVLLVFYRAGLPPRFLLDRAWAMRLHSKKTGIPYGLAIGGAGLLIFPATSWFGVVAANI